MLTGRVFLFAWMGKDPLFQIHFGSTDLKDFNHRAWLDLKESCSLLTILGVKECKNRSVQHTYISVNPKNSPSELVHDFVKLVWSLCSVGSQLLASASLRSKGQADQGLTAFVGTLSRK